jgi:ABC-type multidrug transport system permease subunit
VKNVPEFDASFKNGRLTINKLSQPFVHEVNSGFTVIVDASSTSTDVSKLVPSSNSYLLFSQDKMEFYDGSNGQKTMQPWSKFPEASLNKAKLESLLQKMTEFPYAVIILGLFFVVSYAAVFISKLYSIFVVSLVVSISTHIRGMEWKWKELFSVTLFATTLPSIIEVLVSLTPLKISYIHFIALLAFMLSLVFTVDEKMDKEK